MTRILLTDDDEQIRTTLADYLRTFAFDVRTAATGAGFRDAVASGGLQAIVLDVMLPDANGLELCRWLRHQEDTTPVLMLTAQGDPVSRVIGLEMGADDYLAKPFEPRELVARLNAVLRRTPRPAPGPDVDVPRAVRFAGWTMDCLQRLLVSPTQVAVALSNAEFRLLAAFVARPGRVLSREQLVEATARSVPGPGPAVNDRSIDLAVSRLRQKLNEAHDSPTLIRTVRGEGYVLDAKVFP